jgi:hypothetical protein
MHGVRILLEPPFQRLGVQHLYGRRVPKGPRVIFLGVYCFKPRWRAGAGQGPPRLGEVCQWILQEAAHEMTAAAPLQAHHSAEDRIALGTLDAVIIP